MADDLTPAKLRTVLCTADDFTADNATTVVRTLCGRTINNVEMHVKHDRLHAFTLELDDGTRVELSEWSTWADDSGMSVEVTKP